MESWRLHLRHTTTTAKLVYATGPSATPARTPTSRLPLRAWHVCAVDLSLIWPAGQRRRPHPAAITGSTPPPSRPPPDACLICEECAIPPSSTVVAAGDGSAARPLATARLHAGLLPEHRPLRQVRDMAASVGLRLGRKVTYKEVPYPSACFLSVIKHIRTSLFAIATVIHLSCHFHSFQTHQSAFLQHPRS